MLLVLGQYTGWYEPKQPRSKCHLLCIYLFLTFCVFLFPLFWIHRNFFQAASDRSHLVFNALAIGMVSLLCIQMRNFPVRVQPLVAMVSPSGGKSAFLWGGIGTASKVSTLQVGSSALWKEARRFFKLWESFWSYIFKQWCFRVPKRAGLSHGTFFFFWNKYSKIAYSCSCKRFHKRCTDNKTSHPVLSTFLESLPTADELYARHLLEHSEGLLSLLWKNGLT